MAYDANKIKSIIFAKFILVKSLSSAIKFVNTSAKAMEFYCTTHDPATATGDFGTSLEDVALVSGKFITRRILSETFYRKKFEMSDTKFAKLSRDLKKRSELG